MTLMLTAPGISFWLFFLGFFIASVLAFFIPGDLISRRLNLVGLNRLVVAVALGIVLWGWQGMVFGYLQVRFLSYGYLLVAVVLWWRDHKKITVSLPKNIDWLLGGILALGIAIQMSAVGFIGSILPQGMFFCCRGVPDDIFHLALTDELVKRFPPFEPGMFGIVVHNYHYWANLVMAELVRVFRLPLIPTSYQYFPLLIAVLLGLSLVAFARELTNNKSFARWLAFFAFFHGDILYFLILLRGKGLNLDVTILDDASKLLAGPTRSFSIALFFAGLVLLTRWLRKRDLFSGLLVFLLFGSLIGFKVYTGIFALTGLGLLTVYFFIRRQWKMALLPALAVVLSLIIYLPVNSGAGGLYWNGFYRFENFIVQPAFGLQNLELARLSFLANHQYLPVVALETLFFGTYVIFLFGPVLLGFIQNKRSLEIFGTELNIFLIGSGIITALVGFFFAQTVGGVNTVQFLLTLYFILAIYAAAACSYWLEKIRRPLAAVLAILIIGLTATRVVHEGVQNIQMIFGQQGLLVTSDELTAEDWLASSTPPESLIALSPDWTLAEDLMRVSFLTNRPVFLTGYVGVLADHQAAGAGERKWINDEIFVSTNKTEVTDLLTKNHITYLFFPVGSKPVVGNLGGQLRSVVNQKTVAIWQFTPLQKQKYTTTK